MAAPLRVLIAGGGVAAVEALLALRALAGERVSVAMVAPDPKFRYRPLSVTEPFGLGVPRNLDLLETALEHDATFLRDALAAVDVESRQVTTAGGRALDYDVLLIATGTRGTEAVPGALTFRDSVDGESMGDLVADLDRGRVRRVAFAVPSGVSWPLGLYELALLCAARAREVELAVVELMLVTPEARPLEIFGPRVSEAIAGILARAGIEVRLAASPIEFADGELRLAGGTPMGCDRVVALPRLEVPPLSGLPQERNGFLAVDRFGAVFGADGVFAAGDVTWFPVKQGGLAAQMADSAASAIARLAGAPVDPQPFRPVLRGAILTESGPRYLRTSLTDHSLGDASCSTLWWPPAKIAGKYLAPYLSSGAGRRAPKQPLRDLPVRVGPRPEEDRSEHDDVVAIALSSAEAHAREHDFPGALRWLEVAENLDLYLPTAYEAKRAAWLELA